MLADWRTPYAAAGEELCGLVLDLQVRAAAQVLFAGREDSTVHVLLQAIMFVLGVEALRMVVAAKSSADTDLLSSPPSTSCSALQLIFSTVSIRQCVGLGAFVSFTPILPLTPFSGLQIASSLIFFCFTMKNSIALVLLLNANLQPLPLSIISTSCSALQLLSTASILLLLAWWLDLAAPIVAFLLFPKLCICALASTVVLKVKL